MAKHKQNSTQKEYYKQRKRIQTYINKKKKEGVVFSENALPSIPKKITTSSVNKLKKLTAKELQKKMLFNAETGEVYNQTKAQHIEPQYYPTVSLVDNLRNEVKSLPTDDNEYDESIIKENKNAIQSLPKQGMGRVKGSKTLYHYDYSSYISFALSLIDDMLADYDNDYLQYLYQNNSEISNSINHIKGIPSSQSQLMRDGYTELLNILNMNRPIALEQLKALDY